MQVDDVSQEQLHHMAEQIRKATAANISIVLCVGESDKVEKAEAVQCAIAARVKGGDRRPQHAEAACAVLRSADHLLRQMTGGKMRLQIVGPDGTMELDSGTLDMFEVR